jgi:uncharacterized protein (DUF2267 family)
MSANGLDVFDKALQTTNSWLNDLMQELGPDRQAAWRVLGAVLRAIRDRIPLELAVHLGSQLPLLVRGRGRLGRPGRCGPRRGTRPAAGLMGVREVRWAA